MLRKAKHSKRRGFHGTSNLMPHSSSQVHSTLVEPPLQPSLAPQSCVPSYSTAIPPSIPTAQNLVSASHPPLRTMPHKAKHSKKRGSHGISNLVAHASSQAQSYAPTLSHIPSSIPTTLDPLSRSLLPQNVFSSILNLICQAAYQGYSMLEELPQHSSKLAQPFAPTITDIRPSIPIAQDLVSQSNIPSCSMLRKSKRSKKRVSHAISNLMPHASSQGHSKPMELPLQPSELAQPCAPPVVLVPSSISVTQDPVLPSDPSSIPVNQDPVLPSDPSSIPVNQDLVSPSDSSSIPANQDPSSIAVNQDPVSPSDSSSIPVNQDPVSPSDPSSSPILKI
ncbi:hypothetical protein GLYMA_20G054900v4 [Glycine max]|nr:hypothetical protein GLYMA_20G054900v4 [Glycine max]KAH1034683.1 hypothetical protein GYH30_054893 [Glycine max]